MSNIAVSNSFAGPHTDYHFWDNNRFAYPKEAIELELNYINLLKDEYIKTFRDNSEAMCETISMGDHKKKKETKKMEKSIHKLFNKTFAVIEEKFNDYKVRISEKRRSKSPYTYSYKFSLHAAEKIHDSLNKMSRLCYTENDIANNSIYEMVEKIRATVKNKFKQTVFNKVDELINSLKIEGKPISESSKDVLKKIARKCNVTIFDSYKLDVFLDEVSKREKTTWGDLLGIEGDDAQVRTLVSTACQEGNRASKNYNIFGNIRLFKGLWLNDANPVR